MWRRVDPVKWTDISEEDIASIFRVEKSESVEPAWAGSIFFFQNMESRLKMTFGSNEFPPYSGSKGKTCKQPTLSKLGCDRFVSSELLAWLTLRSWRIRQYVPPKRRWISTALYCVTSQMTVPFIVPRCENLKSSNFSSHDAVRDHSRSTSESNITDAIIHNLQHFSKSLIVWTLPKRRRINMHMNYTISCHVVMLTRNSEFITCQQ
jgi:hypothetical protein